MGFFDRLQPEYLQQVNRGIGGLGGGILQAGLLKQQQAQEQQKAQQDQLLQQQKLGQQADIAAIGADFIPVEPGETPQFKIGDRGYKAKPISQFETVQQSLKMTKQLSDIEKVNAQIKLLEKQTQLQGVEKESTQVKELKKFARDLLATLSSDTKQFTDIPEDKKGIIEETFKLLGQQVEFELYDPGKLSFETERIKSITPSELGSMSTAQLELLLNQIQKGK